MKLNNANITAAAAVIALLLTLFGAIYQQGRLSNQLENLSTQIDQVREENRLDYVDLSRDIEQLRRNNEEIRREIAALRGELQRGDAALREELRFEIAALREELQRGDAALLEELRRSHRELLDALGNHTHDPSDGNALFAIPSNPEPDTGNQSQ